MYEPSNAHSVIHALTCIIQYMNEMFTVVHGVEHKKYVTLNFTQLNYFVSDNIHTVCWYLRVSMSINLSATNTSMKQISS
jgi:hypothetical protein